jgi:hypothetical protein
VSVLTKLAMISERLDPIFYLDSCSLLCVQGDTAMLWKKWDSTIVGSTRTIFPFSLLYGFVET